MEDLFTDAPPFDWECLNNTLAANGQEEVDEDDADARNAVLEMRRQYFAETLNRAFVIREDQAFLLESKDKVKREKAEKRIKRDLDALPAHMGHTEAYFGTENADYLKSIVGRETGFQFDEEYRLTAASIEAPIYTQETENDMAKQTAAKKAENTGEPALPPIPTFEPQPRIVESIPLALIDVSPFETQARRRAHFTDESIAELAEDIRINGLTHPILTRPVPGKKGKPGRQEIVVGERRYLAIKQLGRATIDGSVETLTDAQAFEKQQSENREREPQHPLDEAYAYQFMADHFGYSTDEIALRVGEKPSYVATRKKLLDLSPVAMQAFDEGRITLSHALEIAKYNRQWHQELLNFCFTQSGVGVESLVPVRVFITRIQKNFLHRLEGAPFPLKSTELRSDGLPCAECPERTSSNQRLFSDEYDAKDQCLNPKCWNEKIQNFVQLQRVRVALPERDTAVPLTGKDYKKADAVPKLTDRYLYGSNTEGLISIHNVTELKSIKMCESSETGVLVDGDRISQVVYFCRDGKCPKHARTSSSGRDKSPVEASDERRRRKEELIDIRVGEVVRKRVFKAAAEKFAETFEISEAVTSDLLCQTVAWMRSKCGHEDIDHVVFPILDEWAGQDVPRHTFGGRNGNVEAVAKHFDETTQKRMVFLFLNAHHGSMYGEYGFKSQTEVRDIADRYQIDYQLIDAEERLSYAMGKLKKWTEHFRQYHEAIKAGKRETPIPRVYFEKYKPRD